MTILCAVYVATQNPLAIALPGKNAELEYPIGQLISFMKKARVHGIGHQERWRVCHHGNCGQAHGGDQEDRCAGSSSTRENTSLQLAVLGRAVGSMQALLQKQVRTLKTDLETKIKSQLLTSMAVWPWLVRHSAWLVERYQMRANGRTSYQDCFGTVYTGIVLRFGEQAVFRHLVGTAAGRNQQTFKQLRKEKAANKMDIGIWLGKTYETDEHYMGKSDGIFTARTCRRMPSDGQRKLDAVKAVT